MKKLGILEHNKRLGNGESGEVTLLRERDQGLNSLGMCGYCKGFFNSAHIWKHKHSCDKAEVAQSVKTSVPVQLLSMETSPTLIEEFKDHILCRFRQNEVVSLCCTDKLILEVGRQQFAKSAKHDRKVVMTELRRLAQLTLNCREISGNAVFKCEDLLQLDNFPTLEAALEKVEKKNSLQLGLGYLLKTAAKVMKGIYLSQRKDKEANEMDAFLTILQVT